MTEADRLIVQAAAYEEALKIILAVCDDMEWSYDVASEVEDRLGARIAVLRFEAKQARKKATKEMAL